MDIKGRIAEEIAIRCLCEFNSSNIIDDAFSCRGSLGEFRNTVVYRAMVTLQVPALTIDANNIVEIISDWVISEPSVTVVRIALAVDPDCPAMLDSFDSKDCVTEGSTDKINPPSSSTSSTTSSSVGIIIGIAVAVVSVILLLIITIVMVIMYRRKTSSYRYRISY